MIADQVCDRLASICSSEAESIRATWKNLNTDERKKFAIQLLDDNLPYVLKYDYELNYLEVTRCLVGQM